MVPVEFGGKLVTACLWTKKQKLNMKRNSEFISEKRIKIRQLSQTFDTLRYLFTTYFHSKLKREDSTS